MKKRYFAYIALVLAGIGFGLMPKSHEKWTDTGPANQLILSLKGSSPNMDAARLELRCDGRTSQVRLYMDIGIKPGFGGPPQGPASMGLSEEFQDKNRNPLPKSDAVYGNVWEVSADGTYAIKQDPRSFIGRLMDKDWLTIRGSAYADPTKGVGIDFPVMGLGDYRDRIASACKDS